MSINLFEKFGPKLDERSSLASRTSVACGNNFDGGGMKAIKVFPLMNPPLNDYVARGTIRFGTPTGGKDGGAV